jgi:DNA-binding Lrp family transcriptional regulator
VRKTCRSAARHLQRDGLRRGEPPSGRDARQTNRDLARTLGFAPSTCLERIRSPRACGVITGCPAAVDPAALDRHVQALIHFKIRPLSRAVIETFKTCAAGLPEVSTVYVVTGGDDMIVHVSAPSVDHVHGFLMDKFTARREVVGFGLDDLPAHPQPGNRTPHPLPGRDLPCCRRLHSTGGRYWEARRGQTGVTAWTVQGRRTRRRLRRPPRREL